MYYLEEFLKENTLSDGIGGWICKICDYSSKWIRNTKRHIECKHMEGAEYMCQICFIKCPSKPALTMHIHRKHKS